MDTTEPSINRRKAFLRLALLIPAPSLGVCFGMIWWPDTTHGAGLFFAMKVWLVAFPLICFLRFDKQKLSGSPMRKGGVTLAIITGLVINAVIVGVFALWGDTLIDPELIRSKVTDIGLNSVPKYLGCALYWITANSLIEEYVWRWFVVRHCEHVSRPVGAVILSALGFTVHHIIAMQLYMSWTAVAISATGIFIGGAIWSALYVKDRSIWPCYMSHGIVDVAIFGIGYKLIFM